MSGVREFKFARKMRDGVAIREDGVEVKAFPEAKYPEYATKQSAGADFFCAEDVTIPSVWKGFFKFWEVVKDHIKYLEGAEDTELTKEESRVIQKMFQPTMIHTGIKASMLEDDVLYLYNRSSNPKKLGLILANGVGVVDADYFENPDNDGEIMFAFFNILPWDIKLKAGDKLGQGVFAKFIRPVDGFTVKNDKRVGGFGSTDKEK